MLQLKIPGRHNAVNALAAAACAGELGVSPRQILSGLANFSGIARRFENKGAWRGAIVIDDYAHHPTEVQATLQAARDAYPQRKLVCVFQPHQLSRTRKLLPEFVESLNLASQVYLLPVYAAREDAGPEQLQLAQDIANRVRVPAGVIPSLDRVWETLQTDAGADAVILTLGAGTLTRIHHEPR
jgi:UDP-N-acetylmuramate--alanine ligase